MSQNDGRQPEDPPQNSPNADRPTRATQPGSQEPTDPVAPTEAGDVTPPAPNRGSPAVPDPSVTRSFPPPAPLGASEPRRARFDPPVTREQRAAPPEPRVDPAPPAHRSPVGQQPSAATPPPDPRFNAAPRASGPPANPTSASEPPANPTPPAVVPPPYQVPGKPSTPAWLAPPDRPVPEPPPLSSAHLAPGNAGQSPPAASGLDYRLAPPPSPNPGYGAAPPGATNPGQGFGGTPQPSLPYTPAPIRTSRKGKKVGIVAGVLALIAAGGAGLFAVLGGDSNGIEAAESTSEVEAVTTTTVAEPLGAEELAHSVVQIQLLLDGQPTCSGSGTIVDPDGTVVTNFHVVEQSPFCPHDQIGVAIAESSQVAPTLSYEADLLAFDIELDLAVIRIARSLDGQPITEAFTPLNIGDSDTVGLGDEIRVIGFPGIGGDTVTFTTGSVSGFTNTAEGDERAWMKTDAAITGGNSGGLVADVQGDFIGIPTRVGSGDGQIVDCRVIADSNGDGVLDGRDSCVPIGGFINGIRPVALAIPLIEESKTASPIDQGPPDRDQAMAWNLPDVFNPIWSSGVSEDGFPVDSQVAAVAGQNALCVTWDYENVPIGSLTDAIWVVDGEVLPEASVLGAESTGEGSGTFYACITNDGGLDAGLYELAWLVEGEFVFSEATIVGEGASVTIDVENNTDVPLCGVQFNPTGTATFGMNELIEELRPGDVVTIEVPVGLIIARVFDCDGAIRFENAVGFDVFEDLILTVD